MTYGHLCRTVVFCCSLLVTIETRAFEEPSPSPASNPVAVLNFANRGLGDPEWDWLGKGLADLTIGDLVSQTLRVVSREQMQEMLYEITLRQQQLDPAAVAKMLKVTRYVAGSYLVTGDRVELNASVIDAATGDKHIAP